MVKKTPMMDSAELNVSVNALGAEDTEWVLAVGHEENRVDNVLLAGGRKEIDLKWGTPEGSRNPERDQELRGR